MKQQFRKKEVFYQNIICIILIIFIIFSSISHVNYLKVLESNEELNTYIKEQSKHHESINNIWQKSYTELEDKYFTLLEKEYNRDFSTIPYSREEIYMLAQCVEAEAGHYEGHKNSQRYITQVILNRLHSEEFPNSIQEVIYQKVSGVPQFSVAYNGMMEREVEPETLVNVYDVLMDGTTLPEHVLYFYDECVKDNWVNTLNIYTILEGTVFAYESKEDY